MNIKAYEIISERDYVGGISVTFTYDTLHPIDKIIENLLKYIPLQDIEKEFSGWEGESELKNEKDTLENYYINIDIKNSFLFSPINYDSFQEKLNYFIKDIRKVGIDPESSCTSLEIFQKVMHDICNKNSEFLLLEESMFEYLVLIKSSKVISLFSWKSYA